MALKLEDIRFATELPKIPSALPVVRCAAPDFDSRAKGVEALAARLGLGQLKDVETEFGRALASQHGMVEVFSASGAIWSENLTHDLKAEDEFRDWPDLAEGRDDNKEPILMLGDRASAQASDLAMDLVGAGQFDMTHASKPRITLMQVATANEEGKQLRQGAGEATVVFDYALEDLPVIGAGAKTLIDIIPDGRGMIATGAVNVWRTPKGTEKLRIGGTEAALAAGLLRDPDLMIAAEKKGKITIQKLRLGLMAMPADQQQSVLFPALEVEARVDFEDAKMDHYFIGRTLPVASDKAFAEIGLGSAHFGLGMH